MLRGFLSLATGAPAQTWPHTHPHSAPSARPPSWSRRCRGPHRSHWSPGVGVSKEDGVTKLGPQNPQLSAAAWSPRACFWLGKEEHVPGRRCLAVCPRTGSQPSCALGVWGDEESPCPYSLPHAEAQQAGTALPAATHHRRGQLQAQRAPADDEGQDSQQADPWGGERPSAPPDQGAGGPGPRVCLGVPPPRDLWPPQGQTLCLTH